MAWFDGKIGWDDAIMFPSLVTDAAWSGGKKLWGATGAKNPLGGGGKGAITPDTRVANYSDKAQKMFDRETRNSRKTMGQGLGLIGATAERGNTIGERGDRVYGDGLNAIGTARQNEAFARQEQGGAIGMLRGAAEGTAPSRAELLGRAQIDANARAMRAQAAAARGGSAAGALRSAQATASQNALEGSQQLAALRADEMARARGDYFGAASGMRGQDAQQQMIGAGLIGQGLNAQVQGAGVTMGAGSKLTDAGLQREGMYFGAANQARLAEMQARFELERQRMAAEAAARSANAGMMGSLFGTVGAIGGTVYGGPAGGAAGGAAGSAVGQKVGGG